MLTKDNSLILKKKLSILDHKFKKALKGKIHQHIIIFTVVLHIHILCHDIQASEVHSIIMHAYVGMLH